MYEVSSNTIKKARYIRGIFCLHNAASYFNLGTNIPKGFDMLTENLNNKTCKRSGIVMFHGTNDLTHNLIKLPSGNFITNLDRTILELMDYLPEDEFTSQQMEDYDIENKLDYLTEFNKQYKYCSNENFDLALQCYNEWVLDPH